MSWLFEDPSYVVVIGVAALLFAIVALIVTRRAALLWATLGIAGTLAALLLVERLVVTERERVENLLYQMAADVAANNMPAALEHVDSAEVRRLAGRATQRITFSSVGIGSDLNVELNDTTTPHTATAKFTGSAQFKDRSGQIPYEFFMRKFRVSLKKVGDRWMVTDCEIANFKGP